jgi:signal transduction histidine kinase
MSVAAPAQSSLRSRQRFTFRDPRSYLWTISATWLALAFWQLLGHEKEVTHHPGALVPWVVLVALVNMLPVKTWPHADFTPDIPIFIAGALILSPLEIGLVVFVGSFNKKEFQGAITPSKAIFNRSQAALAAYGGSVAAHKLVDLPAPSVFVLPLALLVLAAIVLLNYVLVGIGIALDFRCGLRSAFRRMSVGSPSDFILTLVAWAVVGAMLAVLYDQVGLAALVAFLAPTLLGRQALSRSQMFIDTNRAYRSRESALGEISRQIYEERFDERRLIAADLHDEVLQPLFKVTLMANVLKADLASGRLLEIDQDLPELLTAAELASTTLRGLIGDLRRSTIGRGGLGPSLVGLARGLQDITAMTFHTDVSAVETAPATELVLYQIAKEALTNAATHSRATNIWVELRQDPECISLSVRDDGIGFDPSIQREGHYGLAIMTERSLAIGGQLYVDSAPKQGSEISLTIRLRT